MGAETETHPSRKEQSVQFGSRRVIRMLVHVTQSVGTSIFIRLSADSGKKFWAESIQVVSWDIPSVCGGARNRGERVMAPRHTSMQLKGTERACERGIHAGVYKCLRLERQ